MINSVTRFSGRVDNYVKYRPGYTTALIQYFEKYCGLTSKSVIADIGSGPGISSRMFLENGNRVIGVEPNDAMRKAGESDLIDFRNFESIKGTAEATSIERESVDLAIAAQAFHWFDPEASKREFCRILKRDGHVILIWNERKLDATPFLAEYEQLLLKYATDYRQVRHENVDTDRIAAFLGHDFGTAIFENEQEFDFDGINGRLLSSSYMPDEASPHFAAMIEELKTLFAKHAESDRITVSYYTKIYHSPSRNLCQ
ncbi:MAG: class I SAM-dependent methyltransferase [Blastocatellia bacterium]|nr:class I SAM-dependent methyltransferase [Blastocatellia bacterium]